RNLAQQEGVGEYVAIRSVPAKDRQAMAEQLSQAAVVTLLSEYEAHPVAIMEALALKRPVLVADTSGLREIAERGLARFVPLKSTPEEIAAAVLEQLEAPLTLPAHFSLPTWDDCARQLQTIYHAVARRREACVS